MRKGDAAHFIDMAALRTVVFGHAPSPPQLPWWNAFPRPQSSCGAAGHLYAVLRYVERNPLRANLCERAEDWKFGSAWRMAYGDEESRLIVSDWPLPIRLFVSDEEWQAHVGNVKT